MVSTWLVGVLINKLGIIWLFYSYSILLVITFIASLFQPVRSQRMDAPLSHNLKLLVSRKSVLLFLLSILLLAITMGVFNNFFTLYMDGLGAQEGTIGLAWSLSALSEVPVMLIAGIIISHIGANGLLQIAFVTYAVRWFAYASIQSPALVLPVQLLHGLSFASFQVGSVTFINERTPKGMRTTGQAILSTVSFGLGPIVGAMLGGYFYDTVGFAVLFRVLSVLTLIGLAVFILANRVKED
jgi:PPP family 3-phenylpropionic acid transporter